MIDEYTFNLLFAQTFCIAIVVTFGSAIIYQLYEMFIKEKLNHV